MKYALCIGFSLVFLGMIVAGCQLGDRVTKSSALPNTFIRDGQPEEGQTWLSDAASFRFFGADKDDEIVAYYTRLEPGLLVAQNRDTGEPDTLWPGEPGYGEDLTVVLDTLWFSDLGCWDPLDHEVTCMDSVLNIDSVRVDADSVISYYDWNRTENENRNYQGLNDAVYRFSVKAVDEADCVDPYPAILHFMVLAATWPEIVVDRCPPIRNASPREYFQFHGELGSMEPHEFLYSWMLTGEHEEDPLFHPWTEWQRGVTETSYAGFQPGLTYIFRVRCAMERAGVQIESRGFRECTFTIRQN
jgi:hypothetical protein